MASRFLHNDIVSQILPHLPIQSLFRFRTTSKFWRDVIDSPLFRKSHVANNNNNNNYNEEDEIVLLHLEYYEKSVILLDSGKPWVNFPTRNISDGRHVTASGRIVTEPSEVVGSVNGLICIRTEKPNGIVNTAVCNPSLGQMKILPRHQTCPYSRSLHIGIGSGNDAADYKVVRVLPCERHRCLHGSVYSKTTNSWRDLACYDEYLFIVEPIKSLGGNRGVLNWRALRGNEEIILSFDVKSEVFRIFENPEYRSLDIDYGKMYAKGGKFVFLALDEDLCLIEHESRLMGNNNNKLCWRKRSRRLPLTSLYLEIGNRITWQNKSAVFDQFVLINQSLYSRYSRKALFYRYSYMEVVKKFIMPEGRFICKFLEYKGSFISP